MNEGKKHLKKEAKEKQITEQRRIEIKRDENTVP
jgi:hypothetical protein